MIADSATIFLHLGHFFIMFLLGWGVRGENPTAFVTAAIHTKYLAVLTWKLKDISLFDEARAITFQGPSFAAAYWKNVPSEAVALYFGMGSRALNAVVKALLSE
jgi:hypothetical protein